MKKMIVFLGVAALLGGGCLPGTSGSVTPSDPQPKVVSVGSMLEPVANPPTIDDTWKTYASKSLDFGFRWPTKGSYAPTWEVKFYTEKDAEMRDECFIFSDSPDVMTKKVQFNVMEFCHSRASEGAAGSMYLQDAFATKNGNQFIVISMVKRVHSASALGCAFAVEFPYSTSATNCSAFKQAEYNATLNTMLSTFGYMK